MDHSQKGAADTSDLDQKPSPSDSFPGSADPASAVASRSGAFWDDLGQRISTSPMPPIESTALTPQDEDKDSATSSSSSSADAKTDEPERDHPTKGEAQLLSAESTVAGIHKLANAIAVLESKVDVSSSRREKALKELNELGHTFSSKAEAHKRADAEIRSGGLNSKRAPTDNDIWGANAAANEAAIKLAEAAASFGVTLPTVQLPTASLPTMMEASVVNGVKEEDGSASPFNVPRWGALVQKLSENDLGRNMLASGGFFDAATATSTTFDSSGQVIGDKVKANNSKKNQGGGNEKEEDNEQSGQFLTSTEWAEMQELESSRLVLLALMSERDERRAMGDEDYEAHVAREVVLQAQFHPLTRGRALHALPHHDLQFEEKVDQSTASWTTANYSHNKRQEGSVNNNDDDDDYDYGEGSTTGGVDSSVFAAAQRRVRSLVSGLAPKSPWASQNAHKQELAAATAQAYESDEARAEAQLQRHAQARSWELAAVPTSSALVQSPLVTLGGQATNNNRNSNFVRPSDAQTELLVARALEAEYAAEKRALKTSLVSDRAPGGWANAAGHRASSIQAQEGRVLPSDEVRRRHSAAAAAAVLGENGRETAAAQLAAQRELRLSASQRAGGASGGGDAGGEADSSSRDSAAMNAPFASQFGGSLAASAHEETVVLAQSLATSDASTNGRGGVSTGAFAGLLPQASDRLRYSILKHNHNNTALQAAKAEASSTSPASIVTAAAAAAAVAGGSSAAALLRKEGALAKSKFSLDALTFAAAASAAVAEREPSVKMSENEDGDDALPPQPLSGWGRASGSGSGRKKATYDNTVAGRSARAEAATMVADQASGAAAVAAAGSALDAALAESRDLNNGDAAVTAEARLLAKRAEDPIQRLSKKVCVRVRF